jgi:phosphatidylglycerol:prolipoprotein diacylglycerol transferase
MIPFFEQPVLSLGPVSIHAFGALVALGIFIGMQVTLSRCRKEGLDPKLCEDLIWYSVLIGFVISHLFDVITYYPERVLEDPLVLLRIWDGISSFGGILGGLAGMAYFFWRKAPGLTMGQRMRYVDTIAYGFPFAWIFGRLGCTVAIDHPGTLTKFFLGTSLEKIEAQEFITGVYVNADAIDQLPTSYEGWGFHNLGFYEMLYTLIVIAPIIFLLGRKRRPPGFFLASFVLIYSPIRFMLDFLRMTDKTYLGLTPGQYAAIGTFLFAAFLLTQLHRLEAQEPAAASSDAPAADKGKKKKKV